MTVSKITSPPTKKEEIDKINEIIDNKQDNLVSGTNIKTINNESLLGSGNITIQGGGSVAVDGTTISKNVSDELQAIAVKDNRSGNAIKTWTGTKAQYDAITTKDSNTLYNITDDTDVTLSLLELLYPVGSIYIGTMSTCPLAVLGIGTWQLVATDRVLQGAGTRGNVGTTVNESLPNITGRFEVKNWSNDTGFCRTSGTDSFYITTSSDNDGNWGTAYESSSSDVKRTLINFDSSRSNATYQNNASVQQDAYLVNIWERIA